MASYMLTLPGLRALEVDNVCVVLSWANLKGHCQNDTCPLDAQRKHQVICYLSPLTSLPEVLL